MDKTNIMLLPFWFNGNLNGKVLIVNQCGDFLFLTRDEFSQIISCKLKQGSDLYYKLKSKHIVADDSDISLQIDLISNQLRTRKAYLNNFTTLHMIVVTCRCNFRCDYCHASSSSLDYKNGDMNWSTAKATVDKIFQSPSPVIKIEFQGGEPLLNWKIIKEIVEYAEIKNHFAKKRMDFVICTNLILMTREIAEFCRKHKIKISTSLDGVKEIQNAHRKMRDGGDGYDKFMSGLALARSILGQDACSPLITVTKSNLHRLRETVDLYSSMGFDGMFIRALNPYGFATKCANELGYSLDEFVDAYKDALYYIIQKNLDGFFFVEQYAALLLQRILTPFPTGFVDLQSPCGDVIEGAIYDYDGNVYASDEGRMLARTGDKRFCLGHVKKNTWQEIFNGSSAHEIVKASCVETLSDCALCPYQLYCGSDPVRYYTECGDLHGYRPTSGFCKKNKAVIEHILSLLEKDDDDINDVFWSWLTHRSIREIRDDD